MTYSGATLLDEEIFPLYGWLVVFSSTNFLSSGCRPDTFVEKLINSDFKTFSNSSLFFLFFDLLNSLTKVLILALMLETPEMFKHLHVSYQNIH